MIEWLNSFDFSWMAWTLPVAMFFAAIAYALWPSKRDTFEHAARLPLTED